MNATPKHLSAMDPSGDPRTQPAMARTASALGLCYTCNSVDTCTGRATWTGPVVHCEEYDDHVEMPRREPPRRDRNEESRSTLSVRPPAGRSDLCMNCRHNETCGFPRQEGGVWHCGEYE